MSIYFRGALLFVLVFSVGCGGARDKTMTTTPEAIDAGPEEEEIEVPLHAEVVVFLLARCAHAAETMRHLIALRREMGPSLGLSLGYVGTLDETGEPDPAGGEAELVAAKVQLCVGMKAADEPWLDFLDCFYEGDRWRSMPSGWEECASRAKLDPKDIENCLNSGEGDAALAQTYGVSMALGIASSPVVIFANRLYLGERTFDAMRRHFCHGVGLPQSVPAACNEVEPPPPIAATLLFDSRCTDPGMCDVSNEAALLEQLIPGLQLTRLDFTTKDGRHLFNLIQKTGIEIHELPVIVLDPDVAANSSALVRMSEYLIPFGKGYLLNMGNGWDPLAEICDNSVDDTGNGRVDCDDESCAEKVACRQEDKGRLDLFIMSGCPFSAELLPVVDRVLDHFGRDRKQFDLHLQFIGQEEGGELRSMHGAEEVAEDLRMICAQKLYGKDYRFMEYLSCRARTFDSPAWEPCVPKWMNKKRLRRCAEGSQGHKLLKESFELADRLGVRGSPSWLLNNRWPMQGRSATKIVEGFCAQNEADGCDKEVASESVESRQTPSNSTCQ